MSDPTRLDIRLRLERDEDHAEVEELTRLAFWNQHVPGCDEHYLAHVLRSSPDFRSDLDFVATIGNRIVGNIMYTCALLVSSEGEELPILSFGPLSVRPEFQRRGVGKALLTHTLALAESEGCPAVAIYGNPSNYVSSGFVCCANVNVGLEPGVFPSALLVRAFKPELLAGRFWSFRPSPAYEVDSEAANEFETRFPPLEKGWRPSQEEFSILSRSFVRV
jgi:predicted N-acetyltransferase YhbS